MCIGPSASSKLPLDSGMALESDWRISLQLNETNTDILFNSSSDE